jgi:hypothetical protein
MKKFLPALIVTLLFSACATYVTPAGTYIEPLPATIIVGPPVIAQPPPHLNIRRLPPVVVAPERHVYYYQGLYYYYWDGLWYYGERDRGPWHRMPREYYPEAYRKQPGRHRR